MQRKFIAILALALLLVMPLASTPRSNADPSTEIKVDPASTTAILNNDYVVYVKIKDVTDLYGWEFQLSYDHTVLHLTSDSIVSGGLNEPTQTYQQLTDDANGHLWWAVSTKYPTVTGINYTDHNIFEIHFHTIGTGTSVLTLNGTILSDSHGNEITATATSGSITVYQKDLTVTNINVDNLGCSIYANDMHADGSTYYYPVEVTVHNTGNLDAEAFHVKLEVIYNSADESQGELNVSSLTAGADAVVNFTAVFHPTNTGTYTLKATVDSQNEVVESDETNNVLQSGAVTVTVIGDINCDHRVNILDAVAISLAFDATPSDSRWNIKADLNHDGVIDVLDATRIGLHWGETS
jgi:hypothetical protein